MYATYSPKFGSGNVYNTHQHFTPFPNHSFSSEWIEYGSLFLNYADSSEEKKRHDQVFHSLVFSQGFFGLLTLSYF